MVDWKNAGPHVPLRAKRAGGAIALLVLGAAAGATALSYTRPGIEMAPVIPTAIAKVPQASGIVTVKGQIAEVYGSRFIMRDGSGRLLIDAGPDGSGQFHSGDTLIVQGRYDNGQLRASYLVDGQGRITDVGTPPHPPQGPGHDGPPPPPPPPGGIGAPPPPPDSAVVPPTSAAPPPVAADDMTRHSGTANPQTRQ